MPTYVFKCLECGVIFEKKLPLGHAGEPAPCPNQHLNTRRVYTSPSVVYRGSGFYTTDHARTHSG